MRGTILDDKGEYQVWLVWKMVDDRPVLIAIDTSLDRATSHVAYDKLEDQAKGKPIDDYFVEDSLLNHLYGQSINGTEASFRIGKIMQRNRKST